jgi:response regulator RpfG family c-di-GMP phosphodiesterase
MKGAKLPTVLLLDDLAEDRTLIEQALGTEARVVRKRSAEELLEHLLGGEPVDLAVVALDMVSDAAAQEVGRVFGLARGTKVLALAPVQQGSGLTTLLRAESLHAHHLLARPLDAHHLLMVLNSMFPAMAPHD